MADESEILMLYCSEKTSFSFSSCDLEKDIKIRLKDKKYLKKNYFFFFFLEFYKKEY